MATGKILASPKMRADSEFRFLGCHCQRKSRRVQVSSRFSGAGSERQTDLFLAEDSYKLKLYDEGADLSFEKSHEDIVLERSYKTWVTRIKNRGDRAHNPAREQARS